MQEEIKNLIHEALKTLDIERVDFAVEHPEDFNNGDYSTNVAMVLAKNLKTNPRELAEKIKFELENNLPEQISKVDVAGAGFINFYLSRKFFTGSTERILNDQNFGKNHLFQNKKIMVEYTDPNPFKPFHIGHLMTNAIGESIARILEHSGAQVSRANYQGDVGLHVAKALYGLRQTGMPEDLGAPVTVLAQHIGNSYVAGNTAYEENPDAKAEIDAINKKIYTREDEELNQVYDWGFKVTMQAFEDLYKILGTQFDYYFLESKVASYGEGLVRENIGQGKNVFEESDGAIVFKAENYDPKLHTRVFITRTGLPTYETKELGLTQEKFKTIPDMHRSIVITANEQTDYMRVVAKALSLIHPEYESKMMHITHGMMRLTTGKMGSRKGNIVTGESLIRDTIAVIEEKLQDRDLPATDKHDIAEAVGVAAIKYSILRSKSGGDIIYDVEESVSVEGDSGPYLQYSQVRANSVLDKAKAENILPDFVNAPEEVTNLEKLLYRFPEVLHRSATTYEPHHIATYLIELARAFNGFYANSVIVDKTDPTSSYKIALTFAFSFVMKKGLHLLGISAPTKM